MDRRRIELQLRAITVTHRIERRRRDSITMRGFRERARMLLDSLEGEVDSHPDLKTELDRIRREIEEADTSSRSDREPANPTVEGARSSRPKPAP